MSSFVDSGFEAQEAREANFRRAINGSPVNWDRVAHTLLSVLACTGVKLLERDASTAISTAGELSPGEKISLARGSILVGYLEVTGNSEQGLSEWIKLSLALQLDSRRRLAAQRELLLHLLHDWRGAAARLTSLTGLLAERSDSAEQILIRQCVDEMEAATSELAFFATLVNDLSAGSSCRLSAAVQRALYEAKRQWPELPALFEIDSSGDCDVAREETLVSAICVRLLLSLQPVFRDGMTFRIRLRKSSSTGSQGAGEIQFSVPNLLTPNDSDFQVAQRVTESCGGMVTIDSDQSGANVIAVIFPAPQNIKRI